MRGTGRSVVAVLVSLAVAVAGTVVLAHSTATSAIAACEGGWSYGDALPLAKAALVGRVLAVRHESPGIDSVTAVRVARVRGRRVGTTYRGRMISACGELPPRIGARVVVLLGVSDQPGRPGDDVYFTIGSTVSASQAAQIGGVLPDTGTASPISPAQPGNANVPLAIVAGLSFAAFLLLLSRRTGRRASRGL